MFRDESNKRAGQQGRSPANDIGDEKYHDLIKEPETVDVDPDVERFNLEVTKKGRQIFKNFQIPDGLSQEEFDKICEEALSETLAIHGQRYRQRINNQNLSIFSTIFSATDDDEENQESASNHTP